MINKYSKSLGKFTDWIENQDTYHKTFKETLAELKRQHGKLESKHFKISRRKATAEGAKE